MPFEFERTSLEGLCIIRPKRFLDARGHFEECYQQEIFAENGISKPFIQDNQSYSKNGTIRGLHYQNPPHAQAKLIRVIVGKILDVAVDIRLNSKTFGNHFSIELDAAKGDMLFVDEGFAHGFAILSVEAIVHYKTTRYYAPEAEDGIFWNDPDLGIDWKTTEPCLSAKDSKLPRLKDKPKDTFPS